MKIIGIEPKAPGLHIFSRMYIPRLGLPQILTIARNMGHQCSIYCEEIAPIAWQNIADADIILISSTTSTAPRAFWLIRKIRETKSNVPIIMGGPHVTFLPEEALDNGADFVFRHEADDSFPRFLEWYSSGKDLQSLNRIPGISFKAGNSIYNTPQSPIVDLDKLPTPDFDLIEGFGKPSSIPLITSRGCPWECEFCSEVAMFGRRYRFRSEANVIEDIRYYDRRYGKLPIFFAEDNFGANRPRLERLCRTIIDNGLIRPIGGQVRLDLAKYPETLRIMTGAGFQRAYIGYESINPDSLKEAGKGLNDGEMGNLTKQFHKHGIAIHAMWVLGFDNDTIDTVKRTIKSSIKWRIETSQFLILVPIPGSKLFYRLKDENRIFNWDWSRYDGHHVNFYPGGMTPRQLQIAVMLDAMPKIYGLWLTMKIFILNNFRLSGTIFKGWRRFVREFRGNLDTLAVRVWGKGAVRKMKKNITKYLEQMPSISRKSRV